MKDSKDSLEWISEMLDNGQEHLICERAAGDARAEREARMIAAVRASVRHRRDTLRVSVPVNVERSIRMAIASEASARSTTGIADRIKNLLAALTSRPALAFASASAVIVVAASVFFMTQRDQVLPSNLTDAALAAYAEVSSDGSDIDLRSGDKNDLRAYFATHGVDFEVFFPTVAAELVGGSVRSINGQDFPVLVYRNAGHVISLLEVEQGAIDARTVDIDRVAADDVARSKWHWASSDDRTLFVWKSNSIMCSVVSDLAVNEVSALFSLEVL